MAVQSSGNVFTHQSSHLVVVGTHKGRVFLRAGLALEHDDGYALVVGTIDGRRDGGHLVRSYNEQVNARSHQTVDLLHLSLIAVVGRRKAQFHVLVEISVHAQLCILFLAPDVVGALRYANDISGLLVGACGQQ